MLYDHDTIPLLACKGRLGVQWLNITSGKAQFSIFIRLTDKSNPIIKKCGMMAKKTLQPSKYFFTLCLNHMMNLNIIMTEG